MTTDVRPANAAETAAAIREAVAAGQPISVRSGGHSGEAFANPDGVLIDLAAQNSVDVDGDLVSVGGGALWGEVALELGKHSLALTSGDTKSVGVGGLTLGGGMGWMVREYGLALDNLVSAEVVTATGDIVTASDSENPDLFWALRGGGGNFGIVTRFTFRARPLDGVVESIQDFDPAQLGTVLRGWRDAMRNAPERLNSTVLLLPGMGPEIPASNRVISVYAGGDEKAAAEAMAEVLAIEPVTESHVAPKAYVDVLEEGPPKPQPGPDGAMPPMPPMPVVTVQNGMIFEFTDEIIDDVTSLYSQLQGPVILTVRYLGGAFSRVAPDATAFAHRKNEVFLMTASFMPPGSPPEAAQPFTTAWSGFEPHTAGMYGNFTLSTSDAILARMYPPATLARLREVKRQWDPQNVFAHNHNVVP